MSKVSVTKAKLDALAAAVANKANEELPLTLDAMREAVNDIRLPSGTISITENGTVDVSQYASASVDVAESSVIDPLTITENGTYTYNGRGGYSPITVNVPSSQINNQNKTVTPTTSQQSVTADSGYTGLGTVTVNAIPSNYGNTTGDTATAANILTGKTAHSNSAGSAVAITGTMPNRGDVTATIDGLITTSYTIPLGYHNGSGTVSLTNAIETALAAI